MIFIKPLLLDRETHTHRVRKSGVSDKNDFCSTGEDKLLVHRKKSTEESDVLSPLIAFYEKLAS